ncbi:MAG: tetratricopeptide repeat protein [Flavobacteriales bacterium]|nr:tetratricopeptide repeat protein [Flavobacteriales bacterium]
MKFSLVLLSFFALQLAFGQDLYKKTLTELFSKYQDKDTLKCHNIYKEILNEEIEIRDSLLSELKSNSLAGLKKKKFTATFQKYLGLFYYEKGYDYYTSANISSAINAFNLALKIHKKINYFQGIADDYNYLCITKMYAGQYLEAEKNAKQAKRYYQLAKDDIGLQNNCYNLSHTYLKLNDLDKAAKTIIEALKISEKIKDSVGLCDNYDQLGTIYLQQMELKLAENYFQKGLFLKRKIKHYKSIASSYRCLGATAYSKKDFKKGDYYFEQAFKNAKNVLQEAAINTTKGLVLFDKQEYEAAEISLNKALELNDNDNTKSNIYPVLAEIYVKIQDWNKAEKYGLEAYKLTKMNLYLDKQQIAAQCLYQVYKNQKKYAKALEFLEISKRLKEKINRKSNQNSLLKADFKFQEEKNRTKIKSLNQATKIAKLESQQKTNWIFSIALLALIGLLVFWVLFSRFKTKKKNELLQSQLTYTKQLLEEKQRTSESEIKAIKSQMNPHFFYNALNSIQGYVLTGEQQKASESIGLFSELSRAILESSRYNEISLFDEIELLTAYLKMEVMRMPKIHFQMDYSSDLRLHDLFLPPMILQPIVENAVKHGLANKESGGLIQLRFQKIDNLLRVEIEDDGIGREAAAEINTLKNRRGTSFSSEANLNRIELLNENFDFKITQVIVDKKDENERATGTLVKVEIPQDNY